MSICPLARSLTFDAKSCLTVSHTVTNVVVLLKFWAPEILPKFWRNFRQILGKFRFQIFGKKIAKFLGKFWRNFHGKVSSKRLKLSCQKFLETFAWNFDESFLAATLTVTLILLDSLQICRSVCRSFYLSVSLSVCRALTFVAKSHLTVSQTDPTRLVADLSVCLLLCLSVCRALTFVAKSRLTVSQTDPARLVAATTLT